MGGVLLAGDVGVRDPGDDALVRAFGRELPRWPLVLTSADPARTAARQEWPVIDVRAPRALLAAVRGCDMLVLGDGALRGAGRGERLRDVLGVALLAKLLGRRLAIVGVSAEALHGRRERLRVDALVRLADLLVLRDPAAAHVLSAAGAPGPFRVGADPAWVALEGAPASLAERDGVLVVLDARAAEQRPAELAAALDMIAARGLRVRLAPWRVSRYGADDIDLARSVAARLGARARVLLPPADMREAAEEAARAQVVVTMRLHGLIVGAGVATPTVVLDARPEARDLARRLGQRHLAADVPPEAVAGAVLDAAGGPGPDPAAIRAEQTAARESFRLVRLLLDGGQSDEDHEVSALPLEPAPFARRRPGPEVRA